MINPEALKLYKENDGFFGLVQLCCDFIEQVQPEIYETEDELFFIALERTYRDYLDAREEERRYFKRYKASIEIQLDKDLDPASSLEIFFRDRLGNQHTLREIHDIKEIPF